MCNINKIMTILVGSFHCTISTYVYTFLTCFPFPNYVFSLLTITHVPINNNNVIIITIVLVLNIIINMVCDIHIMSSIKFI